MCIVVERKARSRYILKKIDYPNNTIDRIDCIDCIDCIERAGIIYKYIRIKYKQSLNNIIACLAFYSTALKCFRL